MVQDADLSSWIRLRGFVGLSRDSSCLGYTGVTVYSCCEVALAGPGESFCIFSIFLVIEIHVQKKKHKHQLLVRDSL